MFSLVIPLFNHNIIMTNYWNFNANNPLITSSDGVGTINGGDISRSVLLKDIIKKQNLKKTN